MTVEVFCHSCSMGTINFDKWDTFEAYMLRWITHSVQVHVKFEKLQEQLMWYREVIELISCVQKVHRCHTENSWEVYIFQIDESISKLVWEKA